MNPDQLRAKALDHCLRHARRKVTGDLAVTVATSRTYRDDFQMRDVYSQNMTIWRKYGRFDIIQNEAGALIGFVDHDKYLESGAAAPDRDAALALIRKAGAVPESAQPQEYQAIPSPSGGGRIGSFRFLLPKPEKDYDALDVEVNGARNAVISVKPKRSGRFHG